MKCEFYILEVFFTNVIKNYTFGNVGKEQNCGRFDANFINYVFVASCFLLGPNFCIKVAIEIL